MYKNNRIDREKAEQLLIRHAKTLQEIKAMIARGELDGNAMLYTLDDTIQLMYEAFKGGWTNCQFQLNPKSEHSSREGTARAKKYIKMAFVGKKK